MRICVFCGSKSGHNELYAAAAQEVGQTLARSGIELVYGGGRIGLMGLVADAALFEGGKVIGVIPRSLVDREIQHTGLTELHVVESMHERKTIMSDLADGFIALPGGAGTLEEIFEQWTWAQLGLHQKPCAFLNSNGYFDPLRNMVERMTAEGFLRADHASMLLFDTRCDTIVEAFQRYSAPLPKFSSGNAYQPARKIIHIVAALAKDSADRILLVRKKGTRAFMQPGGKVRDGESPLETLERELAEELTCSIVPASPRFLGTFTAPAANEADSLVEAALYQVELEGPANPSAEIEEIIWLHPQQATSVELAPLTKDTVFQLAVNQPSFRVLSAGQDSD